MPFRPQQIILATRKRSPDRSTPSRGTKIPQERSLRCNPTDDHPANTENRPESGRPSHSRSRDPSPTNGRSQNIDLVVQPTSHDMLRPPAATHSKLPRPSTAPHRLEALRRQIHFPSHRKSPDPDLATRAPGSCIPFNPKSVCFTYAAKESAIQSFLITGDS